MAPTRLKAGFILFNPMIIPEAVYKKSILDRAEKFFHVKPEITGYLFGKRCRVDAIITPNNYTDWANKSVSFAVEFKHFSDEYEGKGDKSGSMNYYTRQFKQIIDYSYTEFTGYGRLPVLICPPLFNNMTGNLKHQAQLIKNCMGQCNVGELFICNRKGLSIIFNTHHLIWCEKYGVCQGKIQQFLTKTGSGSPL